MSFDTVMLLARSLALIVNITTMFLCMRSKRSKLFTLLVLAGCAVLIAGAIRIAGLSGFILNFSGLLFLPVVLWLFKGQTFQKVFAFFMQYQFSMLMISLADVVTALTVGHESNIAWVVMLLLTLLFIGAYLTAVLRFGRRLFDRLFIDGRRNEWMVYSLGAVLTFLFGMAVRWADIGAWLYFGLVLFILWGFGVLCFAIVNTHENTKHKYEADFAASVIRGASGYYEQINELNNKLHIFQHDLKYNLTVFSNLLAEGNHVELERYFSEVSGRLEQTTPRVYCGNSVINVLLSSYAERCEKQNITYDVSVYLPKEIPIPNYELCIVLGNLLENAVEACENLDGSKRIELIIKPLGKQLVIKASNSYHVESFPVHEAAVDENTLPPSTKKGGGLGLVSVKAVVDKYQGELLVDRDSKLFTAYVTLGL